MLGMAFVMPFVDRKTLGNILMDHFLAKVLNYPDIFSQLMSRQAGKNICRSLVVADQTIMVIQYDYAVSQTLQNFLGRKMTKIVITAAPDDDNDHSHGNHQRNRSKIKYLHQFTDICDQHNDRQSGNPKNRPILAVHLSVRALMNRAYQCVNAQRIRDDDTAEQKKHIQGPICDIDMIKSTRTRYPLNLPVEQTMPVKKYRRQRKETDCGKNS